MAHVESEGEAIRRCQAGEAAGLEWLVQHYQVSATDVAFLLTGDSALAEDIVQESFLTLLRIIGRFQPGKPFAPWFMGIVANTARQRIHDGLHALEHIIRTHYPWLIDDAAIIPLFAENVADTPEAARHEIA